MSRLLRYIIVILLRDWLIIVIVIISFFFTFYYSSLGTAEYKTTNSFTRKTPNQCLVYISVVTILHKKANFITLRHSCKHKTLAVSEESSFRFTDKTNLSIDAQS